MRSVGLLALSVLGMSPAAAQIYPWCLVYQEMTGTVVCAFTSYEQCHLSAGGNAGFCIENPAVPSARKITPAPPPARHAR